MVVKRASPLVFSACPNTKFVTRPRSYAAQISNFSYCIGAALAQTNAIMTGWRIGTRDYEVSLYKTFHPPFS